MSAMDSLKQRINYAGGSNQEHRMNSDKLRSLRKALLYSYQAQTAILSDNREFRCLINHDKLKEDYDDKIISIPYDDICLNAAEMAGKTHEGYQHIGMKVGDVFTWKETDTKWIVIQEILEENAYFRGTIRKAEDEIVIDGNTYYGYLGKWTKDTLWHTKGLNSWSEMGYEVVLYITRNEETENYFHRFKKVTINDRLWEVQMVNDITSETMLIIYLKETFINEFADEEPTDDETPSEGDDTEPGDGDDQGQDEEIAAIVGKDVVYPFDKTSYTLGDENITGGTWLIDNEKKARIISQTDTTVYIYIVTAKSGTINLIYRRENNEDIVKTITIASL